MDKYGWLNDPEVIDFEGIGTFERIPAEHTQLKQQREALGYTQQQIADAAHIALRQYQRFENGERSLTTSSMRIGVNVCKVLGVDPAYFGDMDVYKLPKQSVE